MGTRNLSICVPKNVKYQQKLSVCQNVSPVAEKIDEISSAENPPNCVGGIREFCYVIVILGRFVASLRNTSPQLNLVWELFPGLLHSLNF